MKFTIFVPFLAAALLVNFGCTKFFDRDVELSGPSFTSETLSQITLETGITFPPKTQGVEYLDLGGTIDQSKSAKIHIAEDKNEEFQTNIIFTEGRDQEAHIQFGQTKPWWNLNQLENRQDKGINLENGGYVEISYGKEGDQFTAYLSWVSA